jgi:hypothetical protein
MGWSGGGRLRRGPPFGLAVPAFREVPGDLAGAVRPAFDVGPLCGQTPARRILARTRLDFWLDALLLVAYTLAYSLAFIGVAAHEWLGIGLGVALLVHLTGLPQMVGRRSRKSGP